MRKFILITAMVLVSATAQAGGTRGLTLASNDRPAEVEQPKLVEQRPAATMKAAEAPAATEAPASVARPAPVPTATAAPKVETTQPAAEKAPQTANVDKPKRKRESTEARVIRELHRHGIYW